MKKFTYSNRHKRVDEYQKALNRSWMFFWETYPRKRGEPESVWRPRYYKWLETHHRITWLDRPSERVRWRIECDPTDWKLFVLKYLMFQPTYFRYADE